MARSAATADRGLSGHFIEYLIGVPVSMPADCRASSQRASISGSSARSITTPPYGERLLDPEVHWTTAVEEHLHGPAEVIARLADDPPPAPPAYHEVRDGLIVRWIDTPG